MAPGADCHGNERRDEGATWKSGSARKRRDVEIIGERWRLHVTRKEMRLEQMTERVPARPAALELCPNLFEVLARRALADALLVSASINVRLMMHQRAAVDTSALHRPD